jgi:alpha-beta hydrolase superfamily lysophospholipase
VLRTDKMAPIIAAALAGVGGAIAALALLDTQPAKDGAATLSSPAPVVTLTGWSPHQTRSAAIGGEADDEHTFPGQRVLTHQQTSGRVGAAGFS